MFQKELKAHNAIEMMAIAHAGQELLVTIVIVAREALLEKLRYAESVESVLIAGMKLLSI